MSVPEPQIQQGRGDGGAVRTFSSTIHNGVDLWSEHTRGPQKVALSYCVSTNTWRLGSSASLILSLARSIAGFIK